jgi:hypothetical protein
VSVADGRTAGRALDLQHRVDQIEQSVARYMAAMDNRGIMASACRCRYYWQ